MPARIEFNDKTELNFAISNINQPKKKNTSTLGTNKKKEEETKERWYFCAHETFPNG